MKGLIEREVARRELVDHVKLGPGGIREIEFMVQSFQLIRGGQDRRLQTTSSLLEAHWSYSEAGKLLPGRCDRRVACSLHLPAPPGRIGLQMIGDAQVHRLPDDPLTRERIALAMGAATWDDLLFELNRHRERVSRQFRFVVFGGASSENGKTCEDRLLGTVLGYAGRDGRALAESLARAGFAASDEVARLLLELRSSPLVRKLDEPGRKRLQALLPALLADVAGVGNGGPEGDGRISGMALPRESRELFQLHVLRRVLRIVEAIGQRSSYFALLHENAAAPRAPRRALVATEIF